VQDLAHNPETQLSVYQVFHPTYFFIPIQYTNCQQFHSGAHSDTLCPKYIPQAPLARVPPNLISTKYFKKALEQNHPRRPDTRTSPSCSSTKPPQNRLPPYYTILGLKLQLGQIYLISILQLNFSTPVGTQSLVGGYTPPSYRRH
jgi:hypothetical protein